MKFYSYARPAGSTSVELWQSYVIAVLADGTRRRSPVHLDADYEVSLDAAEDVAAEHRLRLKIAGHEPVSFGEWEPMLSVDPA